MCSIWLLCYCLYPYNPLALKVHYSIWSAGKLFQYDLLYFLFIARWDLWYINSAAIPFLLGSPMSLWKINIELLYAAQPATRATNLWHICIKRQLPNNPTPHYILDHSIYCCVSKLSKPFLQKICNPSCMLMFKFLSCFNPVHFNMLNVINQHDLLWSSHKSFTIGT